LSKLIDTGDFHTELIHDRPVKIELHPSIPKCFKVKLSDFTAPMLITISYTSGSKGISIRSSIKANDSFGQAELPMNQTKRTSSGPGMAGTAWRVGQKDSIRYFQLDLNNVAQLTILLRTFSS